MAGRLNDLEAYMLDVPKLIRERRSVRRPESSLTRFPFKLLYADGHFLHVIQGIEPVVDFQEVPGQRLPIRGRGKLMAPQERDVKPSA